MFDKALIIGGSGMVGSNIDFGYKPTSIELNVCKIETIEKYINNLNNNISCIIYLAAINLRESEQNIKKAIDVNINGTSNTLYFAKKLNIPFILISTGAVFSSTNINVSFDENYIPCPNSNYGYTKHSSERIALLYEKSIIIRTGWLFGGNQKNHYKFVENVIMHLNSNTEIKASNDFVGSPTYVKDLIDKLKEKIINLDYGIHHIVNKGAATGYDIAFEISNILNKNNELISSVKSIDIPNSGPQRSNNEYLITYNINNNMRCWKEALLEYCNSKLTSIHKNCIIEKNYKNRDTCRLCNSFDLYTFYKLNPTPPANSFVINPIIQKTIPLDIAICLKCKHFQLLQIIEPTILYSNYLYVSSTSNTMIQHLKNNVNFFIENLNIQKNDYILEIGANDGVCIQHLLDMGYNNIVGIDPAENIKKRNSLPIICDFFGSSMIPLLQKTYKLFKLIYAFHCCAHIENIQDVFDTINVLLDSDGTFIMEVGYFYEVFKNHYFDTIYHEHIDYHTVTSMNIFASKNNLSLYKINTNTIQGGSIQFFFCKNNRPIEDSILQYLQKEQDIQLHTLNVLDNWKTNIIYCSNDINYLLNSLKTYGKHIIGYGASAKSTTFMYQFNLNNSIIDFIIDDNIYKQNYYSPGLNIPIKSVNILKIQKFDYVIILSFNFINEILDKLSEYRNNGLRIIIPFPKIIIL
jgi:dTDP-4-dehydrorhamnose reductase